MLIVNDHLGKETVAELHDFRKDKQDLAVEHHLDNVTATSMSLCLKRIHIFGDLKDFKPASQLDSLYELFTQSFESKQAASIRCEELTGSCSVELSLGTDVAEFRGKDAVIFGMLPTAFRGRMETLINTTPEPGQTWIFYSTHSPHRLVQRNQELQLSQLKYHKLMTYRWDSDINVRYAKYRVFRNGTDPAKKLSDEDISNKKNLIAWMSSNCHEVFWPRKPFLSRLRARLPLHEYGDCGNRRCLPKRSDKCVGVMQQYKFQLILGNTECNDLIPDDFWTLALANGVVPVIYGVPKSDLERMAPPNSYIHIADYKSLDDLANLIKDLGKDQAEYSRFFDWREVGRLQFSSSIQPEEVCRTLPHLSDGKPQALKTLGKSSWFTGCRKNPDASALQLFTPDRQYKAFNHWALWKVY
ncbi:4-galactosyl-N-acetylglucosaminide 3-alpha-L-fucosyltransferase FUT6-like [Diadema setosum]|uniref:4-galactosyl-N-acetylglucosaminide 3-alpha-L-fucosyltransferase FUT6-like n=1 Tax=Diadema setosum TaxID=31175 RepID=UPI003B39FAFD